MRKSIFNKYSYYQLIILFIVTIIASWFCITVIGTLLGKLIFNFNINTLEKDILSKPALLKYYQTIQSLSLFVIPPFLFAKLCYTKPFSWLTLTRKPEIILLFLTVLLVLLSQPFISFTGVFNYNLTFPPYLKSIENWMRIKESEAQLATNIFLSSDSALDTIINIILIAIIPAFGEELLFRGTLQRLLLNSTQKKHLSVWLTAILFSALHMQFFGFIPRLILGLIFGYLVVYSDNIWTSITAHFTNNFTAYIIYQNSTEQEFENSSTTYPSFFLSAISLLGIIIFFIILKKYKNQLLTKGVLPDQD